MIQEEFKFYKPCKLLQPYIRYYWIFKSNQPLKIAFKYERSKSQRNQPGIRL